MLLPQEDMIRFGLVGVPSAIWPTVQRLAEPALRYQANVGLLRRGWSHFSRIAAATSQLVAKGMRTGLMPGQLYARVVVRQFDTASRMLVSARHRIRGAYP